MGSPNCGLNTYSLSTNCCQHFAKEFIDYACDGRYRLPESFGGQWHIEPGKRVDVGFGVGEVVAGRGNIGGIPVDAHLSGPALRMQATRRGGQMIKAEAFNVTEQVGPVGANVSPNLNTGATYDGRNATGSFIGFGGNVGA